MEKEDLIKYLTTRDFMIAKSEVEYTNGLELMNFSLILADNRKDNKFIPKSKIRDKIKELEKTKNYIISMYAIGILEELLGDDE